MWSWQRAQATVSPLGCLREHVKLVVDLVGPGP